MKKIGVKVLITMVEGRGKWERGERGEEAGKSGGYRWCLVLSVLSCFTF